MCVVAYGNITYLYFNCEFLEIEKMIKMKKCLDLLTGVGCERKFFIFTRSLSDHRLEDVKISHIRNIGILAHIDAGKTTTTERMLYYSGRIQNMGEVHRGNTVTDFLEQERLRGITISSAAVSFMWANHRCNLIDTPGHIDFTIEVESTLNVLDGVIVVLDGSAGVEAQTVTVWRQADRYNLPRIVYINKMDRIDANVDLCFKSLVLKLQAKPLILQMPLYDTSKKFNAIVDLVTLHKYTWESDTKGRMYSSMLIEQRTDEELWEKSSAARTLLTESLADVDDKLANIVIKRETVDNIPAECLLESLRRVTLAQTAVPVMCGSSYKNLGVQPLLNGVIQYLPSPDQRNKRIDHCFRDTLCARAFKVIHDQQKRPVTFFRVYTGKFLKGQKIYNIRQDKTDQTVKLMVPYADENVEISEITCGNIAAITGLKYTATGDFVTETQKAAKSAKKRSDDLNTEDGIDVFRSHAYVPVPVFFCSVELHSQAYQHSLDKALKELQREDPSLFVSYNPETGQTVLGGMGELHLEVIKNRIITEYKIEVELGTLQIAYQETINESGTLTHVIDHKIGSSRHSVSIKLTVLQRNSAEIGDILVLDRSPENAPTLAFLQPRHLLAVQQGILSALSHGPKLNCPVMNAQVMLHSLTISKGISETVITAAASQCVQRILSNCGTNLSEPIMSMEVVTHEDSLSVVLADLSRHRGCIQEISDRGLNKVVTALTPLSELLDYSTDLRTITSGTGSFTMEFHCYQNMLPNDEANAIKNVTGFDV